MRRRDLLAALPALALAPVAASRPARAAAAPLNVLAAPNASSIVMARVMQTEPWQKAVPDSSFRLWRDTDELRAGIVSGATRLFTTPTHVPALFANRGVPVRLLAITSMGHLYVVTDDPAIQTLADLKGRHLTNFFRNDMPDLTFRALLRRAGLEVGRDITIDYVGTPMEAAQMLAAGRSHAAVLSEPPATMAIMMAGKQGRTLHRALSLQQEWGRLFGAPRIPMAGVALHQSLIESAPEVLAVLRAGLKPAADWVPAHLAEAGALAEAKMDMRAEMFRASLKYQNIEVQSARAMQGELLAFYRALMEISPEAVGGRLPDDSLFLEL